MSIAEKISKEIIDAMRAKNNARLLALRNMKAAFGNESLALKKKSGEMLTDVEALVVIKRLVKQRKKSIEEFRNGDREDLAKAEEAELKVVEAFLA